MILFKITAYCPGSCCNKQWAGLLADGTTITKDMKICAADWSILPYLTKIKYNNEIYEVRDVGSSVKGRHIDLLKNTHQKTIEFGVKYEMIEVLHATKDTSN